MPDVLVRNLGADTVEWLKHQADSHGRSLQAELKAIIEKEQAADWEARMRLAQELDDLARMIGSVQGDSADLIREDRDSDHGHDW